MKRHAFTLIELLTVIGIIAVLAAIALPVIARARESGRSVACTSNLKQLGVAITLYCADYDGVYPYGIDPHAMAVIEIAFDEPYRTIAKTMPDLRFVMIPYVNPGPLWRCPSEHPFDYSETNYTFYERFGSSYNYYPYPAMLDQTDSYFINPAISFLMADISFWHSGSYYGDGRLIELFADYHVKNVLYQRYLDSGQKPPL